eukprot:symbB.v1.2.019428.t1/scaffold1589.1/size119216/4
MLTAAAWVFRLHKYVLWSMASALLPMTRQRSLGWRMRTSSTWRWNRLVDDEGPRSDMNVNKNCGTQSGAVEPHELILRAKVLSNLGQCYLATEEFVEAEKHYSEAYSLFDQTVGKRSPLFGMQAWACGNLRFAQHRFDAALPFLGEALYVEVVKDGLSVSEMMKLLDQILHCLDQLRKHLDEKSSGVNRGKQLDALRRALNELIEDPRWDDLHDTLDLAVPRDGNQTPTDARPNVERQLKMGA